MLDNFNQNHMTSQTVGCPIQAYNAETIIFEFMKLRNH